MTTPRRLVLGVLVALALAASPSVTHTVIRTANIGWPLCQRYEPGDWMYIFLDCANAPKNPPDA